MRTFAEFLQRLQHNTWLPGHIDEAVVALLTEVATLPGMIHDEVLNWVDESDAFGLGSRETATHYKWFVCQHETLNYRVWLHQYKPHTRRAVGHAEVPHNHRYSLASTILRGGFLHRVFERKGQHLREVPASAQLTAGDTYTVHYEDIHMLSDLQDGTLTLVVEGPAARHYSEAFYGDSMEPQRFYDFVGLYPGLTRLTGELSPRGERKAAGSLRT